MADTPDMDCPHERRRARDRADQAARRAAAKAAGERVGHALDSLLVDGLALMLAGRDPGDPVRLAFQRALNKAAWARRVPCTPALATRLQARLAMGATLRTALDEVRLEGVGRH